MTSFNAREKEILHEIGRSANGRVLVAILKRRKDELGDVDTIDSTSDYGAQVEGRKVFKQLAKEFIDALTMEKKTRDSNEYDEDDFS